ncbi:MAG: carboxypeptidase regulatory-like domain-containing protein, partial [Vicinamibacterales bacterium]
MPTVFYLVLALALWAPAASAQTATAADGATIAGTVRDDTAAVLPGATITVRAEGGRVAAITVSDAEGRYRLDVLAPATYRVEVALPNFGTRQYTGVRVVAAETRTLDATLPLTISADVMVTAMRTFRNLAERESADGGLLGIADSASEGLVTGRQLEARPIMRVGEILESVPGLVISQHSGEGKANQYYLRGFNLDHGTDFATSVAGLPVNMPTHAHGQGYSDVNFLIPELVSAVQFQKGLYSAEQGDFSTAGASHIRYANVLERPIARVSVGQDDWRRMFGAVSPRIGDGHLLVAAERAHNDGPW